MSRNESFDIFGLNIIMLASYVDFGETAYLQACLNLCWSPGAFRRRGAICHTVFWDLFPLPYQQYLLKNVNDNANFAL